MSAIRLTPFPETGRQRAAGSKYGSGTSLSSSWSPALQLPWLRPPLSKGHAVQCHTLAEKAGSPGRKRRLFERKKVRHEDFHKAGQERDRYQGCRSPKRCRFALGKSLFASGRTGPSVEAPADQDRRSTRFFRQSRPISGAVSSRFRRGGGRPLKFSSSNGRSRIATVRGGREAGRATRPRVFGSRRRRAPRDLESP